MAAEKVYRLIGTHHFNHPLQWGVSPKRALAKMRNTDDGGIALPAGHKLISLRCTICGHELREGIDYTVEDAKPKKPIKGDWYAQHKTLYGNSTSDDGWKREHKRLYPETFDDDSWLKKHKELYE